MDDTGADEFNRATSAEQTRRFRDREVSRDIGYLSQDGKTVTTWMGDTLGEVMSKRVSRVGFRNISGRRPERYYVRVRGIDGRTWLGTGPGPCMYMRLRLAATQR